MKRLRLGLRSVLSVALVAILASSVFSYAPHIEHQEASAASPVLKIHAINLTNENHLEYKASFGGDSVMVESSGKYLLMDTGAGRHYKSVYNFLMRNKITKFALYISHYHVDHYGAFAMLFTESAFQIEKVFLPSKNICKDSKKRSEIADIIVNAATKSGIGLSNIIWLSKGSSFTLGSANVDILGPTNTFSISDYKNNRTYTDYSAALKNYYAGKTETVNAEEAASENDDGIPGEKEPWWTWYVNNNSLVAMISSGNRKYLSTGDIYRDEQTMLLKTYSKSVLKADVMKLSHHGTRDTKEFLAAVRPAYSFAQNFRQNEYVRKGDFYTIRARTSQGNANKYGVSFLQGNEHTELHFVLTNQKVTAYRGTATSEPLTGLVSVVGGENSFDKYDKFYIDGSTGKTVKAFKKINGKTYNFKSSGGLMEKAKYEKDGTYKYWKTYDKKKKKKRFYYKSGEMEKGFKKFKGEIYYLVPESGYAFIAVEKKAGYYIKKMKGDPYLVSTSGKFKAKEGWYGKNGKIFYVKGNMKLATGITNIKTYEKTRIKINPKASEKKAAAEGDEAATESNAKPKYKYVIKSKVRTYFFDLKTCARKTSLQRVKGEYYFFDSDGIMLKNETIEIKGQTLKIGKKGTVKSKIKRPAGTTLITGLSKNEEKIKIATEKDYKFCSFEFLIANKKSLLAADRLTAENEEKIKILKKSNSAFALKLKKNETYYVQCIATRKIGGCEFVSKDNKILKVEFDDLEKLRESELKIA